MKTKNFDITISRKKRMVIASALFFALLPVLFFLLYLISILFDSPEIFFSVVVFLSLSMLMVAILFGIIGLGLGFLVILINMVVTKFGATGKQQVISIGITSFLLGSIPWLLLPNIVDENFTLILLVLPSISGALFLGVNLAALLVSSKKEIS